MIASIKKYTQLLPLFCLILITPYCSKKVINTSPVPIPIDTPLVAKTFVNPLMQGSDPWVIKKDSFYYYTQTLGNRVAIWKTKAMSALSSAPFTTVFTTKQNTPNSDNVWAPELHFINNKWYIYYTAGSGPDATQRLWVLENNSADPTTGSWIDKGEIFNTDANFWAIDGSVFLYKGSQYLLWSGRPNLSFQTQNIYIAKMVNPWTLQTPTIMLSKPELSWEINGDPVNEGPEILENSAGKIFLIYSASGCWTDDYALGMLSLKDSSDPLLATNWDKTALPVFTKSPQNKAFGPGHNAFFKSPDGTEDWIIYHANTNSGEGCGAARNIRMQKFSWKTNGIPDFSSPVNINISLPKPSGE